MRDINELAGQRNASALHYHFGSRRGLIKAVMLRHQLRDRCEADPGYDELEKRTDYAVRDILEIVVVPLVARLDSPSGRDFLRIIPQILGKLSGDLRQGITIRLTMSRVIDLLDGRPRCAAGADSPRALGGVCVDDQLTVCELRGVHRLRRPARPRFARFCDTSGGRDLRCPVRAEYR